MEYMSIPCSKCVRVDVLKPPASTSPAHCSSRNVVLEEKLFLDHACMPTSQCIEKESHHANDIYIFIPMFQGIRVDVLKICFERTAYRPSKIFGLQESFLTTMLPSVRCDDMEKGQPHEGANSHVNPLNHERHSEDIIRASPLAHAEPAARFLCSMSFKEFAMACKE